MYPKNFSKKEEYLGSEILNVTISICWLNKLDVYFVNLTLYVQGFCGRNIIPIDCCKLYEIMDRLFLGKVFWMLYKPFAEDVFGEWVMVLRWTYGQPLDTYGRIDLNAKT